jgi:uncharacterized membrane protein YphA (DoxX/SURF4 family)
LQTELQGLLAKRTDQMKTRLSAAVDLQEEQKALGSMPEPSAEHWMIRWIDRFTPWFLAVIGVALLLGFFSRIAAIGGAGFLLMTILTAPSLPWLPAPPNAEGNYFLVSKNVIEMIALLMLACIPTGRWFGIDALIHAVNPWRKPEE